MAKTPPAKRKSDGLLVRLTASHLRRRSERGRNLSWSSSGSRFCDFRSSNSSLMAGKRQTNEKGVKESAMATREVSKSEIQNLGVKSKKIDAKSYRAWFSKAGKKANAPGNAPIETAKCQKSIAVLEGSVASKRKCGHTDDRQPLRSGTKPLEGKHPQVRSCSGLSVGKRRRERYVDELSKTPEVESDEVVKKRKTAVKMKDHSPHSKPGSERKQIHGRNEGTSVTPADTVPNSSACVYKKSDEKYTSTAHKGDRIVLEETKIHMLGGEERRKLLDVQKSLHLRLKPELSKLCEILQLSDAVKAMAQKLLEYVMNNHPVNTEAATTLQAFQISVCWTAASFLKQKINHKKSLSLANECLNFSCIREEADYFCAMLLCMKHTFLYDTNAKSQKSGELSNKDALKGHSPTASQSATSNLQKVGSKVEDVPYLAKQDIDKGIKEIHKTFKKKMTRAFDKLEKEKGEVLKSYEEGKERLERQQKTESAVIRSCFQKNTSVRTDKLKMLEKEVAEHELRMVKDVQNLERLQLEARVKLEAQENKWVKVVRSWARAELLNSSTSDGTGSCLECSETSEQVGVNKDNDFFASLRVHSLDKVLHRKRSGVIELSVAPENGFDGPLRIAMTPAWPLNVSGSLDMMASGAACMGKNKTGSCSDHPVNVVPVNTCAEKLISDGDTSDNGKVLLDVPEVVCYTDGSEKVPLFEEWTQNTDTIPASDVADKLEVPETVSSTDCPEQPPPLNLSSAQWNPNGDASRVPEKEAPVGLHETVSSSHAGNNVVSVSLHSSEEQVCVMSVTISDKVFESRGYETLSTNDGQGNLASVDPPSDEQTCEKATEYETVSSSRCLHILVSASTPTSEEQIQAVTVPMQDKRVKSGRLQTVSSAGGLENCFPANPPVSEENIPEKSTEHECVSSSHDLHILESVRPPSSEEKISDKPTEHESVREHDLHNFESVSPPSPEEHINVATVPMPDKEVESGVPENISSNIGLENLASVDPTSSKEPNPGKATAKEKSNLQVIESDTETGLSQKNRVNTIVDGNTDGENPLVPTVHSLEALVHGSSATLYQVHQGKATSLATSPAVQSGGVQACDVQNASEPFEHSDYDVPYNEAAVQVQLVQSSITSDPSPPELTSAGGIGIQPSHENHTFNQVAHVPVQFVQNLPLLDQPVLQPIPTGGSGLLFPDTRATNVTHAVNYRPVHHPAPYGASVMSFPWHPDPLQTELEKLNKEKEQTHKSHEDTKQCLQSDCEKEIKEAVAEIRRKYEIMLKETDTEFRLKEKELDAMHNKVLMNHVLAWSFSKYMDSIRESSASGLQQDGSVFIQHVGQQSMQQNAQRHSPVASSSSASPYSPSWQMPLAPLPNLQSNASAPATNSHCTGPPMHTVSLSPALLPRIPARPPQISSFSPTGNPRGGGEIRAPAPHLQAFRPSTSMPNWQAYNNSPAAFPSLNIPRPAPTQQYAPFSTDRSESAEAVPALLRCNASALELVINSRSGTNPPGSFPSWPNVGSNLGQSHVSGSTVSVGSCVNPVHNSGSSDVVCLSDDD